MSSLQGDDFQDLSRTDADQPEVELEAGPRAERPNFLTATRFQDFEVPQEILDGLDKAGFEYCTPIQAQAIPVALDGLDIAGQAQTGTGKTTAFLVPLLTRLLKNKPMEPGVPRAIIVTPTRELALQIHQDALTLAGASELRQVLVIGGMDYKEQAELLASGPEIVICTPGRIIDYLQQGVFKTKGIEVAVVDEADRLLDMGFIKDLKYLLGKLPPYAQRQTMLFSATLDERVLELTYQYMNPPQYITAEPDQSTKVNIAQELYHVGRDEKLPLLMGLLRREEHQRIIIFANTKSGVEWLSKKLTLNGFQAEGITGDLPQPKRLKLMESFKENRLQILVATDVASRGIHVDDVSHVYNYDLPQDAENYVHRIGRTARAGNAGKAVSFGCEDYVFHLEAIENLLGEKIPVFWADQDMFHPDQGGEVRLKDRKGGDRRKSAPAKGGRGGDGDGERRSSFSRGPAKSQRPGGIFGLSPRITGDGAEDARQVLSWATDEIKLPPPAEDIEIEAEVLSDEGLETQEKGEARENGRRRKRRRGRRGRSGAEGDAQAKTGSGETRAEGGEAAQAEMISAKAEVEGAAPETAEKKAPAKGRSEKSRRPSAGKGKATKPESAEAVEKTAAAPASEPRRGEASPQADGDSGGAAGKAPERPTTAEASAASEKASAKKPGRAPRKKTSEAGQTAAAPAVASTSGKAASAEAPGASADASANRVETAVVAEAAKAEKKTARPKKAAAPASSAAGGETAEAAAKKPARKSAAKKTEADSAKAVKAAEKESKPAKAAAAPKAKKTEAASEASPAAEKKPAKKAPAAKAAPKGEKAAPKARASSAAKKSGDEKTGEEAKKAAPKRAASPKKSAAPKSGEAE